MDQEVRSTGGQHMSVSAAGGIFDCLGLWERVFKNGESQKLAYTRAPRHTWGCETIGQPTATEARPICRRAKLEATVDEAVHT